MAETNVLLRVENLVKHFPIKQGIIIQKQTGSVHAVDGVSFDVYQGGTLGLVGESGCGKSTTGRTILQIFRPTSGSVTFDGVDLVNLKGRELRLMRRKMQMIFQDPYSSLNPRMTVGEIVGEPLIIHNVAKGSEIEDRVANLLEMVGLNPSLQSLSTRVLRRATPAHRCRALRFNLHSLFATSLFPRWMFPFRRRWSTCSRTCRGSSTSPICSLRTIFRWCVTSARVSR
jgi:ABC-type glutathione transport system ATPase component